VPIGQSLKMLAAWALIFGAAFLAFTLRDDFKALGQRVMAEVSGGGAQVVQAGETLRIEQSDDGHFWVNAQVNGQTVRFLIDSGATTTSISTETARRAGIETGGGFPALVQTANGTVQVQRGRAEVIKVGTIERRDLAVHISEAFGDMNVIGMNFLSSLSGWSVEGKWLVLKP
jgi:aspartyl protease family protein